jgi:hypothetical protein
MDKFPLLSSIIYVYLCEYQVYHEKLIATFQYFMIKKGTQNSGKYKHL